MNGIPDFDTGYLYVEKDSSYDVEHNLGQLPSKFAFYFSSSEEPKMNKDTIYSVLPMIVSNVGFTISHKNENECTIATGSSYVQGTNTNGYLRIMFWR
jgi:hypothetical protein